MDQEEIETVFRAHPEESARMSEISQRLASLIREADPFIQGHTAAVCPSCKNVCCVNKHSRCEYEDIVYLHALGAEVVPDRSGRKDDEPCRFLGPRGCNRERHLRPYRCTWYFCTPLLEHIQEVPAREYRCFVGALCRMTEERRELEAAFSGIKKELPY